MIKVNIVLRFIQKCGGSYKTSKAPVSGNRDESNFTTKQKVNECAVQLVGVSGVLIIIGRTLNRRFKLL